MAKKANKRFYKTVSLASEGEGFVVKLDQYRLKTPGKMTLALPRKAVAQLIAKEWAAQGEDIDPGSMPITRLLNVAVERTPENREALIAEARKYAGMDLLCYRSHESRLYKEHQDGHWDPLMDWAAEQGVKLTTTESLLAIEQDDRSLDKVANYAKNLDDIALTLFVHLLSTFGSVILAMAVMESHLTGEQAFELSRLDEIWQIKYWGQDEEAQERTDNIRAEIIALCRLLEI